MIELSSPSTKRQIAVAVVFVAIILSSCESSKRADRSFDVCLGSPNETEAAVATLRRVSAKFSYRFREYGHDAKADLKTISAPPSVIPKGRPVQLDIARNDGKILLMASNFGGNGNKLRVSFFYYAEVEESSLFFQTVTSEMKRLPNSEFHPNDSDVNTSTCSD